jgi:hypothetical protein
MAKITPDSGLLETVQSLKGEELTSAVLGYLIAKSPSCYRAFLECLALDRPDQDELPICVESEVETNWLSGGIEIPGRLDLLVDTGTRLIGIENKIWAGFMDDQPAKYCMKLIEESRLRERRDKPMLVVLAPRVKDPEVQKALRQVSENEAFSRIETNSIFWTDLLDSLRSADHESEQITNLYEELRRYVDQRIWFPDFEFAFSKLRAWDGDWNEWQQQLVGYLWYAFPFPGPRVNKSKNWLGYSFFADREDIWAWYGFVNPHTQLHDYNHLSRENEVEFVINFGRDGWEAQSPGTSFIDVRFDQYPSRERGWLVDFNPSWSTFRQWSDSLADAINAIGGAD